MENVFNMNYALIHVKDSVIDAHTSVTTVWGVDAETGEILAKETVEWGIFGVAIKLQTIRDVVVGLRMKRYKTLNESGEALV